MSSKHWKSAGYDVFLSLFFYHSSQELWSTVTIKLIDSPHDYSMNVIRRFCALSKRNSFLWHCECSRYHWHLWMCFLEGSRLCLLFIKGNRKVSWKKHSRNIHPSWCSYTHSGVVAGPVSTISQQPLESETFMNLLWLR